MWCAVQQCERLASHAQTGMLKRLSRTRRKKERQEKVRLLHWGNRCHIIIMPQQPPQKVSWSPGHHLNCRQHSTAHTTQSCTTHTHTQSCHPLATTWVRNRGSISTSIGLCDSNLGCSRHCQSTIPRDTSRQQTLPCGEQHGWGWRIPADPSFMHLLTCLANGGGGVMTAGERS